MALGSERTLGMGTKPDGSILFYAGSKSYDDTAKRSLEEAKDAEQRVRWFREHFASWGGLWEPLFAQAESLVWRPLLVCPADQHWHAKPNATLIGDAAHVMPPYAGEGVNMAMLDALVLARKLGGTGSVAEAIVALRTRDVRSYAPHDRRHDDQHRDRSMHRTPPNKW